ncbi:hypothetical protein CDAR_312331 [Caerostris darwini]|uniref:Uncharacterized protein n=1 Tax=Caerostris darwini TaxID=1538125 RepID=A0AAV4QR96_9ARAC|nr:hypothetical protein CDAR_312331 [Caerostris darwini]
MEAMVSHYRLFPKLIWKATPYLEGDTSTGRQHLISKATPTGIQHLTSKATQTGSQHLISKVTVQLEVQHLISKTTPQLEDSPATSSSQIVLHHLRKRNPRH